MIQQRDTSGVSTSARSALIGLAVGLVAAAVIIGLAFALTGSDEQGTETASATGSSAPGTGTTAAPASTEPQPETVTITMKLHSEPGDFAGYIVNRHNGEPAKQTTFTMPSADWQKTITIPYDAGVKLDVSTVGATCTIEQHVDGQRVRVAHEENSCVAGNY